MEYPTKGAIWRFVRGLAAFILGAGVAFGLGHIQELVPSPVVAGLVSSVLLAFDKYAREKGWISYP